MIEKTEREKNNFIGKWMLVGMTIGIGIGVAMGQIALGLPIGLALGVAIGTHKWKAALRKNKDN